MSKKTYVLSRHTKEIDEITHLIQKDLKDFSKEDFDFAMQLIGGDNKQCVLLFISQLLR